MREVSPGAENKEELAKLIRDAEEFKLALSLLAPAGPSRGFRLLRRAFEAIQDRADLAERECFELREELANLKQANGLGCTKKTGVTTVMSPAAEK